jgi:hypothetical protein
MATAAGCGPSEGLGRRPRGPAARGSSKPFDPYGNAGPWQHVPRWGRRWRGLDEAMDAQMRDVFGEIAAAAGGANAMVDRRPRGRPLASPAWRPHQNRKRVSERDVPKHDLATD